MNNFKTISSRKRRQETTRAIFDKTLQKTNLWLKELATIGKFSSNHVAYIVLRAVLHALRDRLIVQEAVDLGAQLPMLVRGFYYEGWVPAKTPRKQRKKEEFIDAVRQHISNAKVKMSIDEQDAIRAVFTLLHRKITESELYDVKRLLPKKISELFEEE